MFFGFCQLFSHKFKLIQLFFFDNLLSIIILYTKNMYVSLQCLTQHFRTKNFFCKSILQKNNAKRKVPNLAKNHRTGNYQPPPRKPLARTVFLMQKLKRCTRVVTLICGNLQQCKYISNQPPSKIVSNGRCVCSCAVGDEMHTVRLLSSRLVAK